MKHEPRPWHCLLLAAVFLFISVSLACTGDSGPLELTVTFKDAKGLQAGQFLVYKGLRIGEVRSVELGDGGLINVGIEVYEDHRQRVYREAGFRIEKSHLTDLSGEMQVTMEDRGRDRTPVADGDVLAGTEGFFGPLMDRARDLWDSAARAQRQLAEKIDELAESPQGQRLLDGIEDFTDKAKTLGKEKYREFKTEQLPVLEQRAREVKEQLEREGKLDQAREFWERFTAWLEEIEQEAADSQS